MSSYDRYLPRSPLTAFVWPALLALVIVAVLIWRFGGSLLPFGASTSGGVYAKPRDTAARGSLADDEQTTIGIYQRASPAVVHITALTRQSDPVSLNVQQVPRGTGSGFIWSKAGHVVTNFHVVDGGNAWDVTLADHSNWKATLVGAYPDKDLAVLKIDAPASQLTEIEVGTSEDLIVGQNVFAIGNPFGLDQTLTKGIISALNREIESVTRRPIRGMVQTDAAINPGNSGGPLLDSYGRLIGVNTAIYSPTGSYAGIGFAIPVDEVNRVVPEIIAHGKVVRPVLGVQVASDQMTQSYGLPGVLVLEVFPDSPAAKAGLQPTKRRVLGDVILAIDGKAIKSPKDLFVTLEQYKVSDTIKLQVRRGEETVELTVTLAATS